jgi:hypothetical protein
MAYSDFTFEHLQTRFGITLKPSSLFASVTEVMPDDWLVRILERSVSMAQRIGTEKAKSEFIIAPILLEARMLANDAISIFSGTDLNVDEEQGLKGFCDYLITRSTNQLFIEEPIIAIVEAKNDNINGGIPQCIAEMIAARLFNERKGSPKQAVYGAVTTGSLWRFFELRGTTVFADTKDYNVDALGKLLGIFVHIVHHG